MRAMETPARILVGALSFYLLAIALLVAIFALIAFLAVGVLAGLMVLVVTLGKAFSPENALDLRFWKTLLLPATGILTYTVALVMTLLLLFSPIRLFITHWNSQFQKMAWVAGASAALQFVINMLLSSPIPLDDAASKTNDKVVISVNLYPYAQACIWIYAGFVLYALIRLRIAKTPPALPDSTPS